MSHNTDSDSTLLESGCYAFDRKAICQFQVWGVSDRMQQLLDTEGNWHSLLDCSFVRPGVLSVSSQRRRDTLFSKIVWNDQINWDVPRINHHSRHRHAGTVARKRSHAGAKRVA